jgi:hypothetical protein
MSLVEDGPVYRAGQHVTVSGEAAIVEQDQDPTVSGGWVLCRFPERTRWDRGWADPKDIKVAS